MSTTPQPPPPSGPNQDAQDILWKRIAREIRKEVTQAQRDDDDDFDDEANAIAIGIIVLGLLIGAFFLIRPFFQDKPVDPVYTKLEAIRNIQEMTLVKQHYTTLIPVTNADNDKLEFLLRAPVQVYGNIDLSKVQFDVLEDSLIAVYLPGADIPEPYLDIQETVVFSAGKSLFQRMSSRLFSKAQTYLEAYDQIRISLDSATTKVLDRAIVNDIEDETLDQAEMYLRSLIGSLGYRVQFFRTPSVSATGDSLSSAGMLDALRSIEIDASEVMPSRRGLIRRLLTN